MDLTTAKVLSMIVLGLGSFIVGMAPAGISQNARQRHPLLISCLLCFGGGVLLSTSLAHMLPEASEKLPKFAELVFCAGFFIVYIVDEIVHFFNGRERDAGYSHYGSDEQTSLLDRGQDPEMREAGNSRMCHVSHTEPGNQSVSGIIGLLSALFVHSMLEGLAIGLQESASEVLLLLAAVSSHKFVVAFCLGAEVCTSADNRLRRLLVCIALFSGGSAGGIALGAALDNVSEFNDSIAVPIMQSLAAGTLLYVTVSEVLPRERARWHERERGAGLAQLVAASVGFTVMYLSTYYLDRD